MSKKKLKIIFLICLIALILLIFIPKSKKYNENSDIQRDNVEQTKQTTEINLEEIHKFEKIDYNNLSAEQVDYLSNIYTDVMKCTDRGVEIYAESIYSGKLQKIMTSTWPVSEEIGSFIPVPEYGELNRIEYNDTWINVFIENSNKKDAKDYLKKVKEVGFNVNEKKDDGKIMLQYKIYNENGDLVEITYMKETKKLNIYAEKNIK